MHISILVSMNTHSEVILTIVSYLDDGPYYEDNNCAYVINRKVRYQSVFEDDILYLSE